LPANAQKKYLVNSPDGKLSVNVSVDKTITYTVTHEKDLILHPSEIALETGEQTFGLNPKVKSARQKSVDTHIDALFYKKKTIHDAYNELTIEFKDNYKLIFRAYNEGMAYRFVSTLKKPFVVKAEKAQFNLGTNLQAYIPYVTKTGDFETQFFNTFENTYQYQPVNSWKDNQLAFLPLLAEQPGGKKICITEADLENYPGMYLLNKNRDAILQSVYAPYPEVTAQGSHDKSVTTGGHNKVVKQRADYIARCDEGTRNFPWRVVIVSTQDKELLDNDMIYKLASPSRLADTSWIKPGKVAWEWWHDWNLSGVDFKTGVNTQTYKYYIDFAARNGIEYVILDEGWYDKMKGDMLAIVPGIDLPELISYANARQVGLILWVGYYVFDRDVEGYTKYFADMGIKGFKLDAIGRDDQLSIDFHYRCAQAAAKHKLLVDFHGGAKPTGMNRTYPNVLNFEGVHGLEQLKGTYKCDQVTYDVTVPFIRMVAGPMDYTQGAMRNATKAGYRSIWSEPMSQGTRCRQLAEYVIFESPLNMLCDSPTNYLKEPECTAFISSVPTVWDETISITGEVGKHVAIARRHADSWYVGALTGWDARILELNLSFLGDGEYEAEVFRDGINADRNASDYIKEVITLPVNRKLQINMAPGGGFVMKINRK